MQKASVVAMMTLLFLASADILQAGEIMPPVTAKIGGGWMMVELDQSIESLRVKRGMAKLSMVEGSMFFDVFSFYTKPLMISSRTGALSTGPMTFTVQSLSPMQIGSDGSFSGELAGGLTYPLLDEFRGYSVGRQHPLDLRYPHDYRSMPEIVQGTIIGQIRRPIPEPSTLTKNFRTKVKAEVELFTVDHSLVQVHIKGPVNILVTILIQCRFCNGKKLCVQPVGIKSSATDPSPTGTALTNLRSHADELWGRVCVGFNWKKIKYVTNSSWKTLTEGAQEEIDLRASYNDDDCVEIFFIDAWNPTGAHGGGATWGGGNASAKIITSDENDNGIDLHHLAHELGHVVNLTHPWDNCPNPDCPTRVDGNTGTVLCGSGYLNDNPDINSSDNGGNASNPLLTFPTLFTCGRTDCVNDADCGACP